MTWKKYALIICQTASNNRMTLPTNVRPKRKTLNGIAELIEHCLSSYKNFFLSNRKSPVPDIVVFEANDHDTENRKAISMDACGDELETQDIVHSDEESLTEDDIVQEDSTEDPSGRRIVDIFPFFEAIQELNSHDQSNRCNFSNMRFVKEFKQGLNSIFTFTCDVCKYTGTIKSNPHSISNKPLEVNYAAVLGAYAIGIGFYQCQEFLGTLDVPFMAVATFDKRQKLLQKDLRKLAEQVENNAMEREKQIAVEKMEVDINGTPLLSTFADGSFPKRSYRTHYDSLSGTACLIGMNLLCSCVLM